MEEPVPPLLTDSCPVKPGVKVCVPPADEIFKVMLTSVPVAKVWTGLVNPLSEVMALAARAQEFQARPLGAVDEASKHKPFEPADRMPSVPLPVPVISPPF